MADSRNRRRGTGFTNIGRYLQANESNRLGTAVGQGITGKAEEAEDEAKQVASGFQSQAQTARVGEQGGEEQQKVSGIMDKFGQAGFQAPGKDQVGTVTEQEEEAVRGFLSGEYKGPLDIAKQDKEKLQAREGALSRLAGSTRTAEGREALLRRFAGGKGYTTGQQRLDNLLLGKTGTQQLEQARRAATGATGQIRDIAEGAKYEGERYQKEAKDFAEQVRQQFEGIGTGIQEDVRQEAEDRARALIAIRDQERTADTLADQRAALGALGLGEYEYLYGLDPSSAFTSSSIDPVTGEMNLSAGDTAIARDVEEAAKLEALNRMLGGDYDTRVQEEDLVLENIKERLGVGKQEYETAMQSSQAQRQNLLNALRTANYLRQFGDADLSFTNPTHDAWNRMNEQQRYDMLKNLAAYGGAGSGHRQFAAPREVLRAAQQTEGLGDIASRYNISDYQSSADMALLNELLKR